eukprot:2043669-Prymnesium_polylepis.1
MGMHLLHLAHVPRELGEHDAARGREREALPRRADRQQRHAHCAVRPLEGVDARLTHTRARGRTTCIHASVGCMPRAWRHRSHRHPPAFVGARHARGPDAVATN